MATNDVTIKRWHSIEANTLLTRSAIKAVRAGRFFVRRGLTIVFFFKFDADRAPRFPFFFFSFFSEDHKDNLDNNLEKVVKRWAIVPWLLLSLQLVAH